MEHLDLPRESKFVEDLRKQRERILKAAEPGSPKSVEVWEEMRKFKLELEEKFDRDELDAVGAYQALVGSNHHPKTIKDDFDGEYSIARFLADMEEKINAL